MVANLLLFGWCACGVLGVRALVVLLASLVCGV